MTVSRLVSALRDIFSASGGVEDAVPVGRDVPMPVRSAPPEPWRHHECLAGPWTRFVVSYPRDWHSISGQGGDPVRLQPDPRTHLDIAVTVTSHPGNISGPQGILDTVEQLAEARSVPVTRSDVKLDRWGEVGWAGSWAWRDRSASGQRDWQLLVLGHEEGMVLAIVEADPEQLAGSTELVETVLASIRLPDPERLAPDHFPTALCELLNDRLGPGEEPWGFTPQGHLVSGELVVRLPHLYRAYLESGDLDQVASAIDTRARSDVADRFDGAEWEDVRSRLRVVLRRADSLRGLPVVRIPLANDLVACPVLDSPDRITYIPQAEAKRWGMDAMALLTSAVATLDGPVSVVEIRDDETGALMALQVACRDGYDSGRLLCPNLRTSLEETLGAPLIVAMPAAGLVLVGRDDEATRSDLAEAATAGYQRRPRPLSDELWLWTEAGLEPLV